MHESVDEVFKLSFARIVLAGREMELAPRPLNLIRRVIGEQLDVPVSPYPPSLIPVIARPQGTLTSVLM